MASSTAVVFFVRSKYFGLVNLKGPIGGWAYGIPKKVANKRPEKLETEFKPRYEPT